MTNESITPNGPSPRSMQTLRNKHKEEIGLLNAQLQHRADTLAKLRRLIDEKDGEIREVGPIFC